MIDRSAWRLRGAPGPALRRGALVAAPVAVLIAAGIGDEPKVTATLSTSALLAGFVAFDAPARIRAIWLGCVAPVAGLAGAIGAITSEPAVLAVATMTGLGMATGYCVSVSPRFYVAALMLLLGLLITQGLFVGDDEAPRMFVLAIAGTLIQALVALVAWVGWDRTRGRFSLAEGVRRGREALAGNLHRGSPAVEHAVRFGVTLGVGVAIYNIFDLRSHGYWIPLTVLFVLRPETGETIQRLAMRAVGTMAGLVVGTGLAELVGSEPLPVGLVVAAAAAVAYALLALEYAVFTFGITIVVVVLAHAFGEPALQAADERALGTATGIALAGMAVMAGQLARRRSLVRRAG